MSERKRITGAKREVYMWNDTRVDNYNRKRTVSSRETEKSKSEVSRVTLALIASLMLIVVVFLFMKNYELKQLENSVAHGTASNEILRDSIASYNASIDEAKSIQVIGQLAAEKLQMVMVAEESVKTVYIPNHNSVTLTASAGGR